MVISAGVTATQSSPPGAESHPAAVPTSVAAAMAGHPSAAVRAV
jgi:hypothetical protein